MERAAVALLVGLACVATVRAAGAAAAHGLGTGAADAAVPRLAAPASGAVTVRVEPGDTLWGIAMRHAPAGTDPRPWIFRTARLNGLHDAEIRPGEILRLPPGSRG